MTAPRWKTAFERLAAVKVDVSDWERSHSGKPKGRGMWMFSMGVDPSKSNFNISLDSFSHTGSYKDAVKAATAEAKSVGAKKIWVLA